MRNDYFWGNFSDPFLIPLEAKDFTSCSECLASISTHTLTLSHTHTHSRFHTTHTHTHTHGTHTTDFTITQGVRSQNDDSGISLPIYAIAVVAVGVVLLVGITVLIVCCCYISYRRRKMMAVFKVNFQNTYVMLMVFKILTVTSIHYHTCDPLEYRCFRKGV